jgi:NAD+ synthase
MTMIPPLDAEKTTKELVEFLRGVSTRTGISSFVIAVSGGIDSATSLTLACQAYGTDHIYPLLLPYGRISTQGSLDGYLICEANKIPDSRIISADIEPLLAPFIATDPQMDQVRKGNVMARMRMMVVYDYAKRLNALVLGTENRSEYDLGYFTRFGDDASDVEILINLYKTQVYELAKYLEIPRAIIEKAPTAGLWEGQTDEKELGVSYKEIDEVLYAIYSANEDPYQTLPHIPKETIQKVLDRVQNNLFKHQVPYLPERE